MQGLLAQFMLHIWVPGMSAHHSQYCLPSLVVRACINLPYSGHAGFAGTVHAAHMGARHDCTPLSVLLTLTCCLACQRSIAHGAKQGVLRQAALPPVPRPLRPLSNLHIALLLLLRCELHAEVQRKLALLLHLRATTACSQGFVTRRT